MLKLVNFNFADAKIEVDVENAVATDVIIIAGVTGVETITEEEIAKNGANVVIVDTIGVIERNVVVIEMEAVLRLFSRSKWAEFRTVQPLMKLSIGSNLKPNVRALGF